MDARAVRLTDAIAAGVLARELGETLPPAAHVVVTLDATVALRAAVTLVDALVAAGAVDVELTDRPSAAQRTALGVIDVALAAAPPPLRSPPRVAGGDPRTTRQPTATLAPAQVSAGLAAEIVRRYLRRNVNKFTYCYERELLARPTLAGASALSFTIDASGRVVASHTTGFEPAVDACVDRVVRGIELPRPANVDAVRVTTTITFVQS